MAKHILEKYNFSDDVSMRLRGTFLRHKGVVSYCYKTSGSMLYLINRETHPFLEGDQYVKVSANSPDVDVNFLEVGAVNLSYSHTYNIKSAMYFERNPLRRQKAGTCLDTLHVHTFETTPSFLVHYSTDDFLGDYTLFCSFLDMFDNIYTRPITSLSEKSVNGVAISKNLVVVKILSSNSKAFIYFRTNNVGILDYNKRTYRVFANTSSLVEHYIGKYLANTGFVNKGVKI